MVSGLGLLAVGLGAAVGAWLRWLLGLWLNPLFPPVPLGTLAANLIGGLLMGARVKQEVFPETELDMVSISVPYPGASPAEVETPQARLGDSGESTGSREPM